ncbi:MAG: PAS domain S-box protein [Planctomycetota bacterium]
MQTDPPDHGDGEGSDGLLDALLSGLIDAVVVIDPRGRILRVSDSVETMFGWRPTELVGQNVSVLMPEPHRSEHDGYLARYRETGRTWILGTVREFDIARRDGSILPCELSVSRIDVPGRSGELFCGTFRDISERRRARAALARSEARFRAVFEHENELVLLLDADQRVVDANGPTFETTGVTREELVGEPLVDAPFWSGDNGNRAAVRAALDRAREQGLATTRVQVDVRPPSALTGPGDRTIASRSHEVSVRIVPPDVPELPFAIVEVRDITDLVAAERRESSVMRSLARLGEEAAVLSHELRSPVSSLELALKAVARQLGENERMVLDDLSVRMRRLEGLMRRTLSFSRPLELEIEPVAPAHCMGVALEREASTLARSGVRGTIHVESGTPRILADAPVLEDLLSNLVRNAAQAQPEGGVVRLSARPLDAERVEIAVDDEGPGVPVAERENVFRVFRTSKPDGTGLGLPLVRKIAEEHGATVRLTDGESGSGLRVVLAWPCEAVC